METGVIVMFGRIQVEEESAIAAVGGRVGGVPQSSKLKLLFNVLRSIDQQPWETRGQRRLLTICCLLRVDGLTPPAASPLSATCIGHCLSMKLCGQNLLATPSGDFEPHIFRALGLQLQFARQARHRTYRPFPFKKGTATVAFRELGNK